MGKIIITGVDGNFGRHSAKTILTKVAKEYLIFTAPVVEKLKDFQDMGIECRHANFNDPKQLKEAFNGGDTLLFISMPQVGEKRRRMHVNAIMAAKEAGVKKIVYTSIMGAGEIENAGYEIVDHRFTEYLIMALDFNYVFLRDSQYCEAMIAAFEQAAASDGVLCNNMGDGRVAHVARNDCAEAAACVAAGAGEDNKIYYITGPELHNMDEFTAIGSEVTGKKVKYKYIDDEQSYKNFDALGVPRETDGIWAEAAKAFPFCSKGMVSFGTAIRLDQMSFCTDDFEKLTGKKPISTREMFKNADINIIGERTATDS
ncbi:NAD(P)H-binding protein [Alkalibaculum sp. M08DMB]|uniref:NAD(P)H-binding protein n=1 Tax=Alkalibaculum sporogenes TaxID=2655001 RepID=A0A6A7K7Y5_9FIRM|nr:NAD(P)H-binding protein [Alkalibaculum sporogenes]MPW25472.1 NAD(P)H-binding protein [Alkalibaculum sporogenes]